MTQFVVRLTAFLDARDAVATACQGPSTADHLEWCRGELARAALDLDALFAPPSDNDVAQLIATAEAVAGHDQIPADRSPLRWSRDTRILIRNMANALRRLSAELQSKGGAS